MVAESSMLLQHTIPHATDTDIKHTYMYACKYIPTPITTPTPRLHTHTHTHTHIHTSLTKPRWPSSKGRGM